MKAAFGASSTVICSHSAGAFVLLREAEEGEVGPPGFITSH